MQAALAAHTLLGTGLRALPARPARGAPLAPRAASTRLPSAGGRGPGAPSAAASSSSGGYKPEVPSETTPGDLFSIITTLGLTGGSVGTYLDGIHSRVQVLVYDKLALIHGGLHTSAIVPPLLAAFYIVLGGLYIKADGWLLERGDQSTEAAYRRCNLGTMCLSFGALAASLALSSVLYANDVPADQISLVLAGCAAANYLVFDSTKQGLALALLCAVACPASELMLMHIGQLWHYPEATLFTEIPHSGIPSWVPWCYFIYTSAVAQLTRYLKKTS
ncbi:luminal binding Bip2 [Chlorella sorokiniana]|jgi:heat shock protein 5|uniref:Luminal binding Bip2 n=1 Tax=Chlorella sorokiniana TaxID=3076 RepID=A0A2P6TZV6_CHLSO|nr:luminal binding Bip2 [Chlorella sorokiniana]|eukprot:PRW59595.1 luminal binding Bip2 [Chlorella sorokiniana]